MDLKISNQIQRIKKKLILAKEIDKDLEVFGASTHKYFLGNTVTNEKILEFESEYDIELPECYKTFLIHIGNGGVSYKNSAAGPYYGIYPLGENVSELIYENAKTYLKKPCKLYPKMDDEFWAELTKNIENDAISDEDFNNELGNIYSGILPIGHQGCSGYHAIVLSGEFKGKVVHVSDEYYEPTFAYESNFLDWYERWLDGITAEIVIDEKDLFNYTLAGSTSHILDVFVNTQDEETKLECLLGLVKKKKVDPQTLDVLEKKYSISHRKVQNELLQLLTKFDYNRAYPYLMNFAEENLLSVFEFIFWYAKDKSSDWLEFIKANINKITDDETFVFCTYLLKEMNVDYGEIIIPFANSSNEEIKRSTYYSLSQLKNKDKYIDTFIIGLEDKSNHVIHSALQALNGVEDKKLLKYYKRIAEKFPKEQDYILTNLNNRLKAFGLTNETIKEIDPDNY